VYGNGIVNGPGIEVAVEAQHGAFDLGIGNIAALADSFAGMQDVKDHVKGICIFEILRRFSRF